MKEHKTYNKMTVYIDKEIVNKARKRAVDQNKTLSALIRELLCRELAIKNN